MGKFIVKTVPTGIKFNLVASNGEVIATSEVYSSKIACLNGIESVKSIAVRANLLDLTDGGDGIFVNPKFEVYKDKSGQFRFRLRARNGKNIASSEGYSTKAACLGGIESVRNNAPDALVIEKDN